MKSRFHHASSKADDSAIKANYIEYGRRLEKLIGEVRAAYTEMMPLNWRKRREQSLK